MFSRSLSAVAAKDANSSLPGPVGSQMPGRGPESISGMRPWVVRWAASGEFGGVAA